MKSLAVFAILVSLHSSLVSADTLYGCTFIYKPVCGTDLKTYPNECVLKYESARNVKNGLPRIFVLSKGKCPPPCICNTVDQPVCGTDDKTYGNICRLDCENKRRERLGLPLIKKKHDGPCKIPVCKCDNIIRPVCGSDGKTYRNACFLNCASLEQQAQCKPAIHLKYKGPCIKEACDCPRNYDLVCTKDGRTFNNLCLLECWNRRRNELGLPSLIIDYKGKCVECRCLDIYNPVCASNEVTFINECVLDCENKKRKRRGLKPLLLVSKGACPCICMLQYDPVCGSDKITYSNPCLLDCENKKRKDLGWPKIWIQYWGKCV